MTHARRVNSLESSRRTLKEGGSAKIVPVDLLRHDPCFKHFIGPASGANLDLVSLPISALANATGMTTISNALMYRFGVHRPMCMY